LKELLTTQLIFTIKIMLFNILMDGTCGIEDYNGKTKCTFDTIDQMESWLIEEKRLQSKN